MEVRTYHFTWTPEWVLRVGSDCGGGELHWSRGLGQWSNTIGYKTRSSPIWVYTMYGQYRSVRELQAWVNVWHGWPTWERFLVGELSGGRVAWATSNPRTRNLVSRELQVGVFIHLVHHTNRHLKCPILGWMSWPSGAVCHRSLNRTSYLSMTWMLTC